MNLGIWKLAARAALKTALDEKRFGPFVFEIDRPKGFVKEWPQDDGSVKRFKYPCDYGYFVGHTGEDDEGLDAFVGDDPSGPVESFMKLKPDEDGEMVEDETKFLIGLSPAQREKVLGLYADGEIRDLRAYDDVYELIDVLSEFRDKKASARLAARFLQAGSSEHKKSVALMKFLSGVARKEGVAKHVYVVGGAVRNYLLGVPIKDIDVVVDSVELGRGRDSEWFAKQVADAIPAPSSLVTNQYGVAILTVKGEWELDGIDLKGEVIEIANARKESYEGAGGKGKGYKPTDVSPATIQEDVFRREFTFNTLLWRLLDLADGPDKAEVIDITGLGRAHLNEKLISTPVDPDKTFSDDPTRQLRILKFLLRYGLKISPDVAASVKRNAPKLKQMPWEAVANILVHDILDSPRASEGLRVMRSLGMLDVLVEMIRETPPFAAYMNRQLSSGNRPVALLLELADIGFSDKAMEFLTPPQKSRFKAISESLDPDEARKLLDALKRPPADNAAIIQEFALEGRDRGVLVSVARDVLIEDPSTLKNPVELNDRIRDRLRATLPARVASRHLEAKGKYDDIDFKPPAGVAAEAEKGLEYREKASPSNKGGLTPAEASKQGIGSGVQRAVNLKNRDNVTPETISKMVGFFARSEKNKSVSPENRGEPWNDKGHVAWLLWGGDPGKSWAEKVKAQMDKADEKSKTASEERNPHARKMTYDQFKKVYFAEEPKVRDSIAKEFWSDFNYAFNGPLSKYIQETTSKAASSRGADLEDACWDGYEAFGMKEKGGKLVPNCVPVKTASPVRVAARFLSRR